MLALSVRLEMEEIWKNNWHQCQMSHRDRYGAAVWSDRWSGEMCTVVEEVRHETPQIQLPSKKVLTPLHVCCCSSPTRSHQFDTCLHIFFLTAPPPRSLKSTFPCQMSLISKLVSLLPNQQVYLVWAFFFLWWGRICRSEESSWCWPPPSNLRQTEQENNNCHMLMTRNSKTANGDMC